MSGPSWYERAQDELERDLDDGLLTQSEFNAAIRDLNAEVREAAEEAGRNAYDDAMGGW